MMTPLIAHQTWFEPGYENLDWSFATEAATATFLGVAVASTMAVRVLSHWWNGADIPWLARMAPFMPFAVRMHLAVSLVGLLALGSWLSPAMELGHDVIGVLLAIVAALVAGGMATGWHAREAALLLVVAGPLGMLEFGVSPVLQRIDLLGLALFVLVVGPGRWSADHELGRVKEATMRQMGRGLLLLRLAVGSALIVVAFVEKLANPDYAVRFLAEYPELQVAEQIGLNISDLAFVRLAGTAEVLFGLLVISGALPQLVVIAIGIPFNATLYFFGAVELMGHLPIYGVMLLLLVWGSDPDLRPMVRTFWPDRLAPSSEPSEDFPGGREYRHDEQR